MQWFWYVLPGSLFWPDVFPYSFCIMKQPFNLELELKISDTVARKYLFREYICHENLFWNICCFYIFAYIPDLIVNIQRKTTKNGSKHSFLSLPWPYPYSAFFAFTSTCWSAYGKAQLQHMVPDQWGTKITLVKAKKTKFALRGWWSLLLLYLPFVGYHYR